MTWDWKWLEAPAPVWMILLGFLLSLRNSSTDERISEIQDTVEELRRRFCPTESERREDFFGPLEGK